MTAILFTIGFVFLMAFFNSVMDATENEPNFDESIFRRLNKKWWLKSVSWQYCKTILKYHIDGWHLAKTCMVFSFTGALISAIFVGVYLSDDPSLLLICVSVLAVGVTWNATFFLFYNVIFKVK